MKKLLVAIIALFAVFTFAGCAENTTNTTPPSDMQIAEEEKPNDTEQSDNTDKPSDTQPPIEDEKEITAMYLYINGNKLEVTLAKNSSVDALVEILKQGDITYTANDYGNFEKVGNIGHTLPTNDVDIDTQAGDVILYSGNQIVLFYGSNSWSYTRLGKINGYSTSELRTLLGAGKGTVQIKISLT